MKQTQNINLSIYNYDLSQSYLFRTTFVCKQFVYLYLFIILNNNTTKNLSFSVDVDGNITRIKTKWLKQNDIKHTPELIYKFNVSRWRLLIELTSGRRSGSWPVEYTDVGLALVFYVARQAATLPRLIRPSEFLAWSEWNFMLFTQQIVVERIEN